jgi:hypothetical protein
MAFTPEAGSKAMFRALFLLPLLAAAPVPGGAPEPPEFTAASQRFADPAACRAFLGRLVVEAAGSGFDAAEGPYELAPDDVRAHTVRAVGAGHRISEYRCSAAELGERSWTRSMTDEAEEFTVESVARSAAWLKHGGRQQQ